MAIIWVVVLAAFMSALSFKLAKFGHKIHVWFFFNDKRKEMQIIQIYSKTIATSVKLIF